MSTPSHSLLVPCACCGKMVITKNRSKRRTCSPACYMVLWRSDKRAAKIAAQQVADVTKQIINNSKFGELK